jgi:hypothetical protein
LLDLERDRRLGHEKDFGGLGKRQLLGDGVKHLQPAIRHETVPLGCFLLVWRDIQSQITDIR